MIPLKVTTEYSLLKSLIKIPDLMEYLTKNNIKICGICDNELFGVMEFYNACLKNKIKPIIGLEITMQNYPLYLYPKNITGYHKLLKINTLKFIREINLNDINDDNIFILLPYQSIKLYEIFKESKNIYLTYQNAFEKQNIMLLTNNYLYINNIRAFKKEDLKYLEYLKLLGTSFDYSDDYFKNYFDKSDEQNLINFVSQINIVFDYQKSYIPIFNKDIDSYKYLDNLAKKGLSKRLGGKIPLNYVKRLDEELSVIKSLGFTDYFLIVYDYVLFAKKNKIMVGPGRGSAAGSLVSYAIGITEIDPIKYDLLFARFLNPYRKKMPDIDIDFEDTKREIVIDYVKKRYGNENVALGITFNTMKCKLILRDIARILKIDSNLFEKFMKEIDGNQSLSLNKIKPNVIKYLKVYPKLNDLYDICLHLENLKKNTSTHAAGVVISSENLDNIIPIFMEGDIIKTGFPMEYLESMGLLKMDFLSLRNLSFLHNVINKIPNFNIQQINLEDTKVYKLFQNADTDYIFQFESAYAKKNLLKLQVSSFEELSIATALVRPGPSSQIDNYILNKANPNLQIHPALKNILKSTYGVIIFQEQIMKIFEVIGGYTTYEADNIRIAISKKKEDIILKEEANFIQKAVTKGYDKSFVSDLFTQIKKFAEYGFNKAHSVSYATISYEIAYLKVHYPLEFNLTLLESSKDLNDKKRLLQKIKETGIKILKPNINLSTDKYQYKKGFLLLPFNLINGISVNIFEDIIKRRQDGFKDIYDFIIKSYDLLNEKIYTTLVLSGALDNFGFNHQTLINNISILFNYGKLGDVNAAKPLLQNYEEVKSKYEEENEVYGFYIGNHPCAIYKDVIKIKDTSKYLFKKIKMAILIEKITKINTKKGDEMAFIKGSDETGEMDLTIFPDVLKNISDIKINDIILVIGKSSKRFAKYEIIVNSLRVVK